MNRAEGPFRKTVQKIKGELGADLYLASMPVAWDVDFYMGKRIHRHQPERLNTVLVKWLKTKQGAEWMRSNGVGGK